VNEQLKEFGAPPFAETSVSQVQVLRGVRRRGIPDLVEPQTPHQTAKLSSEMSPAEATYIALNLAMNKTMNPNFQMTPKEWEASSVERNEAAKQRHGQAILSSHFVTAATAAFNAKVTQDIANESSEIVQVAHRFLDRLGLPR